MIPLIQVLAAIGLDEEAGTEAVLNLVVALFAVVLLAVSLTAYGKTRLRRLLFVSAAFGLFAAAAAARNVEVFILPGIDVDGVVISLLELLSLVFFFFALVFRD
ncbi:MAG: hypothetical protein ACLQEQ_07205 [Nitrososphaerales archaeon]